MEYSIDYSKGVLHYGNTFRLKKLMKKAEEGGTFTIGFIGGSITQGSVATNCNSCYAYKVFEWWNSTFIKSKFNYVNTGIGATDSQFAVARVCDDLLSFKPDFVITEFSVNDLNNEHFRETYEGLLRKVYNSESKPAVITMNNVFYASGENAEDQHLTLAKYYDVPALGIRPSIYEEIVKGRINTRDITPDDLHPNDAGHKLVAKQITYYLDKVYEANDVPASDIEVKAPITSNTYEFSKRFNNKNCTPSIKGFSLDNSLQNGVSDCFKNGWTASKPGAKIKFEFTGTNFSVMYKKCFKHPAPIAKLTLDDTKEIILDANFDETWGDKLFLEMIDEHLPDTNHTIEIELIETHKDDTAPFYLASVLVSGKNYKNI